MTLTEALAAFEEAASAHSAATDNGDARKANRNWKRVVRAVSVLHKQNAIPQLFPLLGHLTAGVQVWAASYLLPVDEQMATIVLEEVANSNGIQSLGAGIVLEEWRAGRLKLVYHV